MRIPRLERILGIAILAWGLAACSSEANNDDGGSGDAGPELDGDAGTSPDGNPGSDADGTGEVDGAGQDAHEADGHRDADPDPTDGDVETDSGHDAQPDGDPDPTTVPLDGFGEISGECGVLDDEWLSGSPFLYRNVIDFGALAFDESLLSAGGLEIWEEGNLGGSSVESEIIAFEMLYRCELAELVLTEGEIVYDDPAGKKTDLLLRIDGRDVGVSVTRAFHYPPEDGYTVEEARDLLEDKLADVLLSAENAAAENDWERSILHILAWSPAFADAVVEAYGAIDSAIAGSTIVVVTATDGEDDFVY